MSILGGTEHAVVPGDVFHESGGIGGGRRVKPSLKIQGWGNGEASKGQAQRGNEHGTQTG